jgi:hypothetical protein
MVELISGTNNLCKLIAVEATDGGRYHAKVAWFAPSIWQEWLELDNGQLLRVPEGCRDVGGSVLLTDVELTIKD